MTRRRLLSTASREAFFSIPSDMGSLQQYYLLSNADFELISTRRGDENRLGMAIHIAILRHPGQGWQKGHVLPEAFIGWLADQLVIEAAVLNRYGLRDTTRSAHRFLAMRHLGLRLFASDDWKAAVTLAAQAAFETDEGRVIVARLMVELQKRHLVLPGAALIERLALKGRARARRLAAQAIIDALSTDQKVSLAGLLPYDSKLGQSRLTWLRGYPHSTSSASLHALLERLKYLREIELPIDLGQNIHPARLTKFAREGAVAPVHLLNDFGERRRIATLAAQMVDLNITLTDAAIALFERLTGQLFSRSKNKQDQVWSTGKARVGRLMKMFGETIDTMNSAQELGNDPFEALDLKIGWERLLQSRDEITAFGELATSDPLILASERYTQMRKFAPAFLEAFAFNVPEAGADLQAAVALLKNQNSTGKRNLPEIVPMPFAAKHWRSLIYKNGRPNRRTYETAVVSTLRDRLRAGDVWVEGSRDYRRFDSYLIPKAEALPLLQNAGLETDPHIWLKQRRQHLNQRLHDVQDKLRKDQLEGVRLESGRLKITPHEAVTPPEALRLERAIDAVMPRIRITDLLWEVHAKTGFLDAFTDLRSNRTHENPAAVLATILAGATNLGLERMAIASKNISHAQLSWANMWYLRPETYSEALGKIIDAHHKLPFCAVWGDAEKTSSDGQFFASNWGSGQINPKYGPDPGLKIYSFLSGQYGSFHSSVIGATVGEAPFVLDGLVGNPAQLDPLIHYTDTGGVSDHVFALFYLLGLNFVPRIRDFPDRRLACFGKPSQWKLLAPVMGKPINEDAVISHWGDVLRMAASTKTAAVKPSAMLRKLGAYRQQNRLHLALGEIGRVERTLFMLDWIENPTLRKECQAGLNKGEARHTLAKAVFAHSQGRIHDRSDAAQQKRAMALNLVIAAITFWNTMYMEKATDHLRQQGQIPDPSLLKHASPQGWENIILTGDYDWYSGADQRTNSRPLHVSSTRKWLR